MHHPFVNTTISVIGLGYIGLPSAAIFASRGVNVIGVDVNQQTVDVINAGGVHIVEPELDIVVRAVVAEGRLRATTTPQSADAFLIAVPTPLKDGHEPDLSFIRAASVAIAPVLKRGDVVILESTSPVGTTEDMTRWLAEVRPDLTFPLEHGELSDIRVAHCPERVLPGHVLRELVENDRIIGGITPSCSEAASRLYKVFVEGECIITDAKTAEMCKLTENAFRDVSIAFANEISIICDGLGVDVWNLINLANRHPRVNILQPGPGVGGHCIAVDPWFIVHSRPDDAQLIKVARSVNDGKPDWVEQKVLDAVAKRGRAESAATIACLGLAFKANIDDLRQSPALAISKKLAERFGEKVIAVEPNIDALPNDLARLGVRLVDLDEALACADILVLLVDHREFTQLVPMVPKTVTLIDTKGIWSARR